MDAEAGRLTTRGVTLLFSKQIPYKGVSTTTVASRLCGGADHNHMSWQFVLVGQICLYFFLCTVTVTFYLSVSTVIMLINKMVVI